MYYTQKKIVFLPANCNVDVVSSIQLIDGEIVTMNSVLAFPPKLSCNSLVSLLSRYGI